MINGACDLIGGFEPFPGESVLTDVKGAGRGEDALIFGVFAELVCDEDGRSEGLDESCDGRDGVRAFLPLDGKLVCEDPRWPTTSGVTVADRAMDECEKGIYNN